MPRDETNYYLETLMVASLASSDPFIKQAAVSDMVASVITSVKNYAKSQIDHNHKAASVFNILAPGIFGALGFPGISMLLWLAKEIFDFKPADLLQEIAHGLESSLVSGAQISPEQVDQLAQQAVAGSGSDPSDEEIAQKLNGTSVQKSNSLTLHDIQLYKIALMDVDLDPKDIGQKLSLEKRAGVANWLAAPFRLGGMKVFTANILARLLGWIVKTVLISCEFMALGAFVQHITGHNPGAETSPTAPTTPDTAAPITAVQTLWPVSPSYAPESLNTTSGWMEGVPPSQIEDQIVAWTQDIYQDLKGKQNFIKSSTILQKLVQAIQQYNANNTSNVTFMPKRFTSRKMVVDYFIDELAAKAAELAKQTDAASPKK